MKLNQKILIPIIIFVTLQGCSYTNMLTSKCKNHILNFFSPSQKRIKYLSPEKCYLVAGEINSASIEKFPVIVIAMSYKFSKNEIVDFEALPKPGVFTLFLPEGKYKIIALADKNRNSIFQNDELAGVYKNDELISVGANIAINKIITNVNINISYTDPASYNYHLSIKVPDFINKNKSKHPTGPIISLENDIFSPEYATFGLYYPSLFLEKIDYFLYKLEEYDERKIPILFVHGAGGTPRDWKFIADRIDTSRFQPWFFYYPSGANLDQIAEGLFKAIDYKKNKFDDLVITAHSMGGLVVRSALNKYKKYRRDDYIKLFISFCTPFGGNDMAKMAIKQAPVVVESWKDVASNSSFIKSLYKQSIPSHIDFYLFFSHCNNNLIKLGSNSDESITLKSQLDKRAQSETIKIYGFDETHQSILSSEEALKKFNKILSQLKT